MESADLRELLEAVRSQGLSVEEALKQLGDGRDVADLGFAHVDLQRQRRCGFPEVIFGEGKTPEWIVAVAGQLAQAGQDCLATRVNEAQAAALHQQFPQAEYDRLARTFWLPAGPRP